MIGLTAGAASAESIDRRLFETVHEDWQSPFMDDAMSVTNEFGHNLHVIGAAATLALVGGVAGNDDMR
ncbi:MAG: hypothetical protein O3A46_11805, partial [Candidatus Poribacteria bacterium]|nr:hypothetical protein [Candidatus Poribacteria bacterium]